MPEVSKNKLAKLHAFIESCTMRICSFFHFFYKQDKFENYNNLDTKVQIQLRKFFVKFKFFYNFQKILYLSQIIIFIYQLISFLIYSYAIKIFKESIEDKPELKKMRSIDNSTIEFFTTRVFGFEIKDEPSNITGLFWTARHNPNDFNLTQSTTFWLSVTSKFGNTCFCLYMDVSRVEISSNSLSL